MSKKFQLPSDMFVTHESKDYVLLEHICNPLVASWEGMALSYFDGNPDKMYLPVDDAIGFLIREAEDNDNQEFRIDCSVKISILVRFQRAAASDRQEISIEPLAGTKVAPAPEFPKVVGAAGPEGLYLRLADGREYALPTDPIKALGLLHHLSQKTWCDAQFLRFAMMRIAESNSWTIHPFQE